MLDEITDLRIVLKLDLVREDYLVAKLLGRRHCKDCGKQFNVAHVENAEDGVLMPPILPPHGDPQFCECGSVLQARPDDIEDTIRKRLAIYNKSTLPLVNYYRSRGILKQFLVRRGLDDMPAILNLVKEQAEVGKVLGRKSQKAS